MLQKNNNEKKNLTVSGEYALIRRKLRENYRREQKIILKILSKILREDRMNLKVTL